MEELTLALAAKEKVSGSTAGMSEIAEPLKGTRARGAEPAAAEAGSILDWVQEIIPSSEGGEEGFESILCEGPSGVTWQGAPICRASKGERERNDEEQVSKRSVNRDETGGV